MANVLVYVELEGAHLHPRTLATLGEARRMASTLGASLYALLVCAELPSYDDDDIVAVLSRHGADRIVLVASPALRGPGLFAVHGPAVLSACAQLRPALLLFPAT